MQAPFPDGFRCPDQSFAVFEKTLKAKGVNPADVCGVMGETYQGCNACLMPAEYAQALRKWCDKNKAILIFDEVQAGFGRSGKTFGFMHTGIVPDLAACGKGISGGMPLSAVLGTEELMNMYGPGEMTSTHSANPICSAAALANLQVIKKDKLIENAARLAPILAEGTKNVAEAALGHIGRWNATGLVGCVQWTKGGTTTPEPELAWQMVWRAIKRGIMVFAPVGVGGCAIKLCPPLMVTEEALREGLDEMVEVAGEVGAQAEKFLAAAK